MNREEAVKKFIDNLEALAPGDRAILKRNAGNTLSEAYGGALAIFYKLLPYSVYPSEEELWFTAATLRFINRYTTDVSKGGHPKDFGWTMRIARSSESFDMRVRALLDCRWNEGDGALAHRLRQMVKLAENQNAPLDWETFLMDLLRWEHPERWTQKKWARSYFGVTEENDNNEKAGGMSHVD